MRRKLFFNVCFLFVFCAAGFSEEATYVDLSGKTESFQAAHKVFQESCMMCHSAQIPLPWYGHVPGVKQMMKHEYREAIDAFNLDQSIYVAGQAPSAEALNHIERMVQRGKMPPRSYRLTHPKSRLSKQEKQAILDWIRDERSRALTPVVLLPKPISDSTVRSESQEVSSVSAQTDPPASARSKQPNPFKPFNS